MTSLESRSVVETKHFPDSVRPQDAELLQKPVWAHIHITDVGDKPRDYDAAETERAGHLYPEGFRAYGVDDAHGLKYAAHYFTQFPDLIRDTVNRGAEHAELQSRSMPPHLLHVQDLLRQRALRVLLNCAPRNEALAENTNGRDFFLIITKSGVQFYCTPVEAAGYIGPDIASVYRIPTKTNPLHPPEEQFRSRIVGETGLLAPEALQLVWQEGESTEQLHSLIRPPVTDEVGYRDEPFHNRRIMTPDIDRSWDAIDSNSYYDGTVRIRVGTSIIRAHIAQSLRTVPEGKWGVYRNPADTHIPGKFAAYELTRRYDQGQNWTEKGQDPDAYLRPKDRKLGTQVEILPKSRLRNAKRFLPGNKPNA